MFKKSRFVSVAVAAIAGILAFPQHYSFASVPDTCTVPLVLAVDGTKGPHTPTSIDPASPLNAIAGDYRALGYVVEHVEYPGGILAGVAGWTQNYDDSVAIGTSRLRDRIAVQEHTCGSSTDTSSSGTPRVRASSGIWLRRSTAATSARISPPGPSPALRDPRQPQTGIEVALAGKRAPTGVTFTGERAPFRLVEVEWICAPTDGVCDAREPLGADTFAGYLMTHTSYR